MNTTPNRRKDANVPIQKPSEPLPSIFETQRRTGFSTAKLRKPMKKRTRDDRDKSASSEAWN